MLQKNQIVLLQITGITNEGNGIARYENIAVFVPFTAVGDVVRVRIVKVLKRYCYGIIEELVTPGPSRIPTDCSSFGRCGGCSLRHIAYDEELGLKRGWVRENFKRIAGFELPPFEILSAGCPNGYRNKALMPISGRAGNAVFGFYSRRSHRVVPSETCGLHPPFFITIRDAVLKFINIHNLKPYDESLHQGLARALFIRYAAATGQVMVALVINGRDMPYQDEFIQAVKAVCPNVRSIQLNFNTEQTNVVMGKECRVIYGDSVITDRLLGIDVELSALSFYQVNHDAAELLYKTAAEFAGLKPCDTLLDLYCGAGTIGLSMAGSVKRLIGVEIVPQAIENAKRNCEINGIDNARFICADAAAAAQQLLREGISPDVVIVDPPRKGCSRELLNTIAEMSPDRIVMISCDSATAARDAKILSDLGFRPKFAAAVDMFPRTDNVETVVPFENING